MEERFDSLLKLDYDWDSYGAEPLDKVTVNRAKAVVNHLIDKGCFIPNIVPTVDGGIELDWYNPDWEFSIEFAPKDFEYVYFRDDLYEWEGPVDEPEAKECFKIGMKAISESFLEEELPSINSVSEMLLEIEDEILSN